MKYYKGTRKRKRSSKSKAVSPGSQNTTSTSATKDVNQVLLETDDPLSSSTKEKPKGKKRPSSTSPLTEEHRSTEKAKRAKTRHTTSKAEPRNNNKSEKSNTVSDSAVENEPETSGKPKKRSQSGTMSTRSRSKGSTSVVTPPHRVSTRKRVKSNEVSQTHSDSSLSTSSKTREISRKKVYGKAKLPNPRKPDQSKSKSSNSSETPDSAFEDNDDEMQPIVKRRESESSLEVASGGGTSEGLMSYSEFLQQQVQILKTSFEIEDCPELAEHLQGTKRQQKNHIPREIILKVLRKLNYKVEDDLLKTLNRQAQRKILKQIDEIRTEEMMGKKGLKDNDSEQEPEKDVEDLKKTLETSTIELESLKKLADMAAKIECMADDFSKNPLVEEVKRTNELIQKINQQVKKEGFANLFEKAETTNDPLSHKEIVNKLFS